MSKITNREIIDLYSELCKVDKEMGALEQRKAYLRATLASVIPSGGSKAGVAHIARIGSSVSWGKAAKDIIDQLVPHTRSEEAKAIVASHTAETVSHIFKLA